MENFSEFYVKIRLLTNVTLTNNKYFWDDNRFPTFSFFVMYNALPYTQALTERFFLLLSQNKQPFRRCLFSAGYNVGFPDGVM